MAENPQIPWGREMGKLEEQLQTEKPAAAQLSGTCVIYSFVKKYFFFS